MQVLSEAPVQGARKPQVRGKQAAPARVVAHRKTQALLDAADAEAYEVAVVSGGAEAGSAS